MYINFCIQPHLSLLKADISYHNIWESEFDNIISKKDIVQDININQLKLEVHDSYEKDDKITRNFEAVNDENVTVYNLPC